MTTAEITYCHDLIRFYRYLAGPVASMRTDEESIANLQLQFDHILGIMRWIVENDANIQSCDVERFQRALGKKNLGGHRSPAEALNQDDIRRIGAMLSGGRVTFEDILSAYRLDRDLDNGVLAAIRRRAALVRKKG